MPKLGFGCVITYYILLVPTNEAHISPIIYG